jgi:hypothetical protein
MWPSPPRSKVEGGKRMKPNQTYKGKFQHLGHLGCVRSSLVFWFLWFLAYFEISTCQVYLFRKSVQQYLDADCGYWWTLSLTTLILQCLWCVTGGDGVCQYVSNVQIPRMNSPRYEQMNACLTLVSSCLSSLRTIRSTMFLFSYRTQPGMPKIYMVPNPNHHCMVDA